MKGSVVLKIEGKKIGFAFTGSFCTFKRVLEELKKIKKEKADIIPIMSSNSYNLDTKFGKAEEYISEIKSITEKDEIIHTIQGAEPIGPKKLTDVMVIAPCSRKYNCQTCKWNYRYLSSYGCQISSKK